MPAERFRYSRVAHLEAGRKLVEEDSEILTNVRASFVSGDYVQPAVRRRARQAESSKGTIHSERPALSSSAKPMVRLGALEVL